MKPGTETELKYRKFFGEASEIFQKELGKIYERV